MLDILTIRDRLNQLPFRAGERQILFGRISERSQGDQYDFEEVADFEEVESPVNAGAAESKAVRAYLDELASGLGKFDLILCRGEDDPDELYVVQKLRQPTEVDLSWLREGMNWVARITTAVLEMIIPGIVGMWLDRGLGTQFIALLGFVVGVPLGLWHLVQMTRRKADRDVR